MGAGGARPAGAGGAQQPPPGSIQVAPGEMEAINRLASLGFPKARAAEAYFACDKNEEFAANFLFEAGAEDEDVATQNALLASQNEVIGQPAQAQAQAQAEPEADQNMEGAADQQNNNAEAEQ